MNAADHTSDMSTGTTNDITVRRRLRDGDADAIADLHSRVYASEYGLDERFVEGVRRGLEAAVSSGWPHRGGGVWLVDGDDRLLGALGLTNEADGAGRLRWLVLDPALRGHGLARSLVRSEEHTSELQSRQYLVCRLLLEKKKTSILRRATSYYKSRTTKPGRR